MLVNEFLLSGDIVCLDSIYYKALSQIFVCSHKIDDLI